MSSFGKKPKYRSEYLPESQDIVESKATSKPGRFCNHCMIMPEKTGDGVSTEFRPHMFLKRRADPVLDHHYENCMIQVEKFPEAAGSDDFNSK